MNTDESERIAQRIFEPIAAVALDAVRSRVQQLESYCESPIEIMLGAAILSYSAMIDACPGFPLILVRQEHVAVLSPEARVLVPQYKFQNYRIDWVLRDAPTTVCIECDGHDFHERTKQQATRDKQRDRALQQAGYPVLRFTGSEIYKDPILCASQVIEFVWERNGSEALKSA